MPLWRTIAVWAVRAIGIALGAALALIYLLLMLDSPPHADWPHGRLGTVVGLYLATPLLLFAAPVWALGWAAAFISPLASNKKDRETDP